MKVVLELQDQPSNVRKVTVRHDIVIGRGADCNLRLSAPQISRRHCFLRVGRDEVSVTDLDSSNGTFVNGKRIPSGTRCQLANGSELSLGPIRFRIHIRDEAAAADSSAHAGDSRSSAKTVHAAHAGDSSTVVADANAILSGGPLTLGNAMKLSVEQAGSAAESSEETARIAGFKDEVSAPFGEQQGQGSDRVDSRPRNADAGPKIAATNASPIASELASSVPVASQNDNGLDDPPTAAASKSASSALAGSPQTSKSAEDLSIATFFNHDLGSAAELDVVEIVEDDPPDEPSVPLSHASSDVELVEDVDEVVEVVEVEEYIEEVLPVDAVVEVVEEIQDVEEVNDEDLDLDVVEVVEEVAESGEDWFGNTASDEGDDDIDPELNKFLKGF